MMSINKALLHRIFRKIGFIFAVLIIFAAVISSLFRSLTPFVKEYKQDIASELSQLIGQEVSIDNIKTSWYWFHPVLRLEHVTLRDKHDAIHVEKILIGFDLLSSLLHWDIQPGMLYIEGAHLQIKERDNAWEVKGLSRSLSKKTMVLSQKEQQWLTLFMRQHRFLVKDVAIKWSFKDETSITLNGIKLSVVNHGNFYKIKGSAGLAQAADPSLKILGKVYIDPEQRVKTKGSLYVQVKHLALKKWQHFLLPSTFHLQEGFTDIAVWLDLNEGKLSALQSRLEGKNLQWRFANQLSTKTIPVFAANLSFKPEPKGWLLQADHVQLTMGQFIWPENQFLLRYDRKKDSYLAFIKSIIIESLLVDNTDLLPEFVTQLKPHGFLSDFQLVIKERRPQYVLTRFDDLGWSLLDHIPGIEHFSGVLHWQPEEGHLELDTEKAAIILPHLPIQRLTFLNGVFDWKELNNGFRLSVDRFNLSQPELALSAQGMIDGLSRDSIGNIQLDMDFSAGHIQKWFPYLPQPYVKPQLYSWLNKGMKKIEKATGTVKLNGLAKDFPFDNGNGEFSITSRVLGGELLITPKWPLIQALEGNINLKNRNLNIDILNGDCQGVPVKMMNLRIDNIGQDKETLFGQGVFEGAGQKMLDFILKSPVKKQLAKLNMLSLKGLLLLNLHLEIPLYPENNEDLVSGDLTLKDNRIMIKHQMGVLAIDKVNGQLFFNETGVLHSNLDANFMGYPLNIKAQSIQTPYPYTSLLLDGQYNIDSLRVKLKWPILTALQGVFPINAMLKIASDSKHSDSLTIKSSLLGLAIRLPAPIGKIADKSISLLADVDFVTDKQIHTKIEYGDVISADFLFNNHTDDLFELKSGQINLGNRYAIAQKKDGLMISGILDGFDLQKWSDIIREYSTSTAKISWLDKLQFIDLQFNKLVFLQQSFDKLVIKGILLPNKNWSFNVTQKKVAGDLTYNPSQNLLSGFVNYLHLEPISSSKNRQRTSALRIKPQQVPNLNLRVDDLSLGAIAIGNLTLKSHSSSNKLTLDYCRIDSPVYQLSIDGDWSEKQTNVQIQAHLTDLAQTLERWSMTPAVYARKGDIRFNGGWPHGLLDFSLAAVQGKLYMQLKNGRITHLSPETESKLGLGKLLSILSLQTIPRRLKLDFSDLSHEGYSFDVFKGNFDIQQGIMNTQDSYIDGPVAYASMKGDLDIVRHLYDLNLNIVPHITASLPIVATIAGGPVIGIAAWVANKIINQGMQKITGYSYKVSGPWESPVVQQLNIVKKVVNKR